MFSANTMVVILLQYINASNQPIVHLKLMQCYMQLFHKINKKILRRKNFKKVPIWLLCPYIIYKGWYLCLTGLLWGLHRQSPSVLPMRCQMKFKIPTQHPRSWSGVYHSSSLSLPRFPFVYFPLFTLDFGPQTILSSLVPKCAMIFPLFLMKTWLKPYFLPVPCGPIIC